MDIKSVKQLGISQHIPASRRHRQFSHFKKETLTTEMRIGGLLCLPPRDDYLLAHLYKYDCQNYQLERQLWTSELVPGLTLIAAATYKQTESASATQILLLITHTLA